MILSHYLMLGKPTLAISAAKMKQKPETKYNDVIETRTQCAVLHYREIIFDLQSWKLGLGKNSSRSSYCVC